MIKLNKKIIVAIDGFSSCGKSSFAKLIAKELNYMYLDSGAMYRAVSLFGMQEGLIVGDEISKPELTGQLGAIEIKFERKGSELNTMLNGKNVEAEIRGVEVSSVVSNVSKIAAVRERLVQLQQEMGKEKALVMDGRDIGTVVFPDAEIKIFMEARVDVRAKRRYDEMKQKGIEVSLDEISKNIEARDHNDIHRDISPLRKASDAHVLDNSDMSFSQQMDWFRELVENKNLLAAKD